MFPAAFFTGDFVSLVDGINHDGNLRVFCNNGAGSTNGLDGEFVSFLDYDNKYTISDRSRPVCKVGASLRSTTDK